MIKKWRYQRKRGKTDNEELPQSEGSYQEPLSQEKIRKLNEEVTNVWDMNAQGWRSFRNANVTAIEYLGGVCGCGKSENWPYCDGSHNDPGKEVIHNVYRTGSN